MCFLRRCSIRNIFLLLQCRAFFVIRDLFYAFSSYEYDLPVLFLDVLNNSEIFFFTIVLQCKQCTVYKVGYVSHKKDTSSCKTGNVGKRGAVFLKCNTDECFYTMFTCYRCVTWLRCATKARMKRSEWRVLFRSPVLILCLTLTQGKSCFIDRCGSVYTFYGREGNFPISWASWLLAVVGTVWEKPSTGCAPPLESAAPSWTLHSCL